VLSTLAVLAAVLYPRISDGAFSARVDAVALDVDRLRAAAVNAREETGTWPPTGPVELLVPGLTEADGESAPPDGAPRFTWRRLEAVEVPEPSTELADSIPEALAEAGLEPPAPEPSFYHRGAISVRSADPSLLGALLDRYPGSFVHDGVWTLLLARVPAPQGT
jgi:hypothetical protein